MDAFTVIGVAPFVLWWVVRCLAADTKRCACGWKGDGRRARFCPRCGGTL